jgi:tyrosyl-tRNA synthetase
MANVIQTLGERGFIERLTDPALEAVCQEKRVTVYCGFDPTADSLHCGNLLGILALSHFQRAGHKVIAVVGGATGLIGDPGGRKDERKLLSVEDVQRNVEGIRGVLSKFLSFEGANAAKILNNFDWMGPVTFLDFIRDVGKHVRITEMLARDSVKGRLDSGAGMSFTEFSYQLLQAYDFYYLHTHQGCDVQIGGSDQWGNITAGTDLIRRLGGDQTYGLVWPLLTNASGQKFGKSEGGAIWLTADRTSPYQFYQYWVRTEDADAGRFLKLLTFLPLDEIADLERSIEKEPEKREAQKRLAWEMTALVHGEKGAQAAVKASEALFGGELDGLGADIILDIFSEVPSFSIEPGRFDQGYPMVDALAESGLASSKGEARRLIQGGGVYVNNHRVESADSPLTKENLLDGGLLVLRVGKKKYCLGRTG